MRLKINDFMDETNLFFGILSINPWIILATWLDSKAPQEKTKEFILYSFQTSNYSQFMQYWNWMCLILLESLYNLEFNHGGGMF
jgi:hypothetical protein